jgi:RNA polymerase sigma-70 factor (ECF subfamily)
VHDEISLLSRARALDEEALSEIHNRYYPGVYRYISWRISDPQTAEDLASEVFVRFLAALRERSSPPNTLRGWLFGAAANVVKEQYRRQGQITFTELNEGIQANGHTPEQALLDKSEREQVELALQELTSEQQHVLALRFGFGMPIREVAETVNKSEGSVKMLQLRALQTLAQGVRKLGAGS